MNPPPEIKWGWGEPGNDKIEPGIQPVCDRVNQCGWAWTMESCEGHADGRNPFVRIVARLEHVGHLMRLVRLAFPPVDGASAMTFPGTWLLEGDWYDVIVHISRDPYGDSSLEARRAKFMRLAELVCEQPPAGLSAKAEDETPPLS